MKIKNKKNPKNFTSQNDVPAETKQVQANASLCVLVCFRCRLVLCCCLIPFFMKSFKDAYHTCPRCNRVLHVEKKKCCK